MFHLAEIIVEKANNSSFNVLSIKTFLALMEAQRKEYSDFSFQSSQSFALVLRAKKNKIEEVALKIVQLQNHASEIEQMKREYTTLKQLPYSDYFAAIHRQFYLTEDDKTNEQYFNGIANLDEKGFFVQEMELFQSDLSQVLQKFRYDQNNLTDSIKENLAIQMLDAMNMLHQRQIVHGNIKMESFLISSSQKDAPIKLKLSNIGLTSPVSLINQNNEQSAKDNLNNVLSQTKTVKYSIEQDLFSLGQIILQLDNIMTLDYSTLSSSECAELHGENIFQNHQLNRNTLLYQIASILQSKSKKYGQDARSMLLLLLQKSEENMKIPVFSIVLKTTINSISQQFFSKSKIQSLPLRGINQESKLNCLINQLFDKEPYARHLTSQLLKSALEKLFDLKDYSGVYDILGCNANRVIFGVENLKEKRNSVLKLSLCTNKAEILQEIEIMQVCQSPYVVKFYGYQFFEDENHNEFVVYELERCMYSLTQHLELQKIKGEYSEEQKTNLMFQIIDSVNFLHQNKVIHRDIKLDSFLITENQQGQLVAKLHNFRCAGSLKQCYIYSDILENYIFQRQYFSPFNCIIQQYKGESIIYYAPERQDKPYATTYKTDLFSVGLCLILLDNYLVFSEEQLALELYKFSLLDYQLFKDGRFSINTTTFIYRIASQLLNYIPNHRSTLRDIIKDYQFSRYGSRNGYDLLQQIELGMPLSNIINQQIMSLNLYDNTPKNNNEQPILLPLSNLINLSSLSLKIDLNLIQPVRAQALLLPFSNLKNLSSISLDLTGYIQRQSFLSPLENLINLTSINVILNSNQIDPSIAQSLLSPLQNLTNLQNFSLNLTGNQIKDDGAINILSHLRSILNMSRISIKLVGNNVKENGAKFLLSPLANLRNLKRFSLDLNFNSIAATGAQYLMSPLSNLTNLISISLSLNYNSIGDIGAQHLLIPLNTLSNLQSLSLDLNNNSIQAIGAQYLLSPISNLLSLSSFSLNLIGNTISSIGAQQLLSPLKNLVNLSSISLDLNFNSIGNDGAKDLLYPLSNLINLSTLYLNLIGNAIEAVGAESLLQPLSNLINLSSIQLDLNGNLIGASGAQKLLLPLANLVNLSIFSLNLSGNQIGTKGAEYLLSPLSCLTNLTSISLNLLGNSIKDIGEYYLLYPISCLHNLTSLSLHLESNYISKQTQHLFYLFLKNLMILMYQD